MTLQIESSHPNGIGAYFFSASCSNVSAWVSVYDDGHLQVCGKNAAHRAWRGGGSRFESVTEALAAYKTPEMKAIITAAVAASIVMTPV